MLQVKEKGEETADCEAKLTISSIWKLLPPIYCETRGYMVKPNNTLKSTHSTFSSVYSCFLFLPLTAVHGQKPSPIIHFLWGFFIRIHFCICSNSVSFYCSFFVVVFVFFFCCQCRFWLVTKTNFRKRCEEDFSRSWSILIKPHKW